MSPGAQAWASACRALGLLARDPAGLKGLHLRARAGPVRDRFLQGFGAIPLPRRRLYPGMGDDELFGGIDLAQTLAVGKIAYSRGVAESPATLILTMAERCSPDLAARLTQVLDRDDRFCLILLDEGAGPDETVPPALTERLAFRADLDAVALTEADLSTLPGRPIGAAAPVRVTAEQIALLTTLAARFGIASLRAPRLALRAARASAALSGRETLDADDLQTAAELVFAHRATQMPEASEDAADETPPPEKEPEGESDGPGPDSLPEDMMVEAVRALLPEGLLAGLAPAGTERGARGSGAGARRKGNRRGRPLPSRPGRLSTRARIDLVATLRAAAPWQKVRSGLSLRGHHAPRGPVILPQDIHLKRYEDRSDRLVIFAVDASGSSALARLGEAKGAIEILLAEAYARRDHVALIAFRGSEAEILLPPTRSLVQTKRRLSALPGGGGTPLASGLEAVGRLTEQARGHGLSPSLALLTDGRANIALDGGADRARAREDAERMARWLRAMALSGVVIDTAARPQKPLEALALQLGAPYLALPRADSARLSAAIGAALGD